MSKFYLKKASSNEYYLFYDRKTFNTSKGNKILIPMIKSKTQLIKKINSEFFKKNSNFMQLLFFSNDMDDNKKLVDEFQTSEPIDLHELRKQIDKVKGDVVNIKDSSVDINALTSDIVDEERKFAMIAKFVIDES